MIEQSWDNKVKAHHAGTLKRASWFALLPAILMAATPMVLLLVVFHFLRQTLGTQRAPTNPTL
ncbi:MAG: hypothetical protein ACLQGT_13360 [Terracidiphilus sp.]